MHRQLKWQFSYFCGVNLIKNMNVIVWQKIGIFLFIILTVNSLIKLMFFRRKSSRRILEWTGKSKRDSLWWLNETSSLLQFHSLANNAKWRHTHIKRTLQINILLQTLTADIYPIFWNSQYTCTKTSERFDFHLTS